MNPEEELEPYMDLMMDIAEVMIHMKEHIANEKNDARNQNDRDSSFEAVGQKSTQD